jgi:hypothetical protein
MGLALLITRMRRRARLPVQVDGFSLEWRWGPTNCTHRLFSWLLLDSAGSSFGLNGTATRISDWRLWSGNEMKRIGRHYIDQSRF